MKAYEALREISALLGTRVEYFEDEAYQVLESMNISELQTLEVGLHSLRSAVKAMTDKKISEMMAAD